MGVNIRVVFKKWDWKPWTGFLWLRIGTVGGLVWIWRWTFSLYEMRTSWGPVRFCIKDCSMEIVKMWMSLLQVTVIYCELLREWMQYSETNYPRPLFSASGTSSLHISPVSAYRTLHVIVACQPSHPIKYSYLPVLLSRLWQPECENIGTFPKQLQK